MNCVSAEGNVNACCTSDLLNSQNSMCRWINAEALVFFCFVLFSVILNVISVTLILKTESFVQFNIAL